MEELKTLKNHLKAWDSFFKVYSQEPVNNVYVKSFDDKNLLKSLIKTFISDLLIYQSIYKSYAALEDISFNIFLPLKIYIYGRNERYGFEYQPVICEADNYQSKIDTLKNWFADFEDSNKPIPNMKLISTIQYEILNNDFLFKKNGFYNEDVTHLSLDDNSIDRDFIANDKTENLSRTDVLTFAIELLNDEERSFFKEDGIVQSLLNIAVFTKRNKVNIEKLKASSLKSSLAAVMARNQSHNIGSHVLNKMSSSQVAKGFFDIYKNPELCFLQDFNIKDDAPLSKNFLNDKSSILVEVKSKKINEDFYLATFENSEERYKPVYILTQKPDADSLDPAELSRVFNNYLKQRMDFVADVATSDQFALANKKFLISDMFRSFERNLLLMHNISGKGAEFPFTFKFEYYAKGADTPQKDFDPIVSIPNDVLGDQAFYILLENIIRNTAKHAPQKLGHITFTIKIEDNFDNFFKVSIYDNIEYVLTEEEKLEYKNNPDTMDKARRNKLLKLIAHRNNNIAQEILDPETNEIRAHGWGTIEMKIACCYLNRIPSTSIDEIEYAPLGLQLSRVVESDEANFEYDKYDAFLNTEEECCLEYKGWIENPTAFRRTRNGSSHLPLLQAIDGSKNLTSGFGYSFLLKKPKEVLILDKEGVLSSFLGEPLESLDLDLRNSKNETIGKILQQLGINVFSSIDENTVYVHNYFLVIGDHLGEHTGMSNLPQEMCSVKMSKEDVLCEYSYFDYSNQEIVPASKKELYDYLGYCLENNEATNLTRVFDELYFGSIKEFVTPLIGNSDGLGTKNLHNLNFENAVNRINVVEPIKGYYEHHGLEKTGFLEKFGNSGFVELYGSSSRIGFYLISSDNKIGKVVNSNRSALSNIRDSMYHFLAKGCNTSIAIVDERVQKVLSDEAFVAENKRGISGDFKYSYRDIFKGIKIIVPQEKEINLNQTGLNTKREEMLKWIGTKTKTCHYLIIHFGIIESLRVDNEGISEVKKEVKKLCDKNNCKLVITSGRGFTKDVANLNEYFLSYSSLSNLVLDKNNRSKAHLVSVLNALRKAKIENG